MNRPLRNRFLQLLRSVTSPFASHAGDDRSSLVSRKGFFRTPRVESLEGRRVMAANITQFTPTDSGFVVQFSEAVDATKINLYTTSGGAMGAADVTVQGATTGAVKGSAVFSGTSMTFVATGGVLPADTYTVTLRSAADGFTDAADGELLDGEKNANFPSGNGTAGGNFVTTFTVSAGTSVAVGFSDIARGPGQSLQGPASGSGAALPEGLAIQLSNAAGVTSVTMTFQYDPSLMTISEIKLGPDAPSGSQIQSNLATPGVATLSFFALAPLTADQTDIVQVIATVPTTATYGKAQVLDVTAVEVNAGALTAKANDAVHVAAYPGDANANQRYDAEDARLIARVGVGSDSGFVSATPTSATVTTPLYPLIDPMLLGDVTGVDGISPLDASDVLRKVIGLSVPNLPNLPSQAPTNVTLSSSTVASGSASGTTVGSFTTTDPDVGDTHTYTLVAGTGDTDNASFTISGNQLRTAAVFNAATKSSYSLRVRATDASGKFFEKTFTVTVSSANQAPTDLALSSSSIAESQTTGAIVGNFTTTDPDSGNTFTYSLVTGTGSTDNSSFTITNNQLVLNTALNFENKASYAIRVRTTDNGGATFEKALTIAVTNVNEAPTLIAASGTVVPSGAAVGTTVGTLTTTDPDASDTHTYTLVTGTGDTDNAKFTITGNQLKTAATFTSQTTFSIRVRTTDAAGLTLEQVITGTVAAGNVAPTDIALSSTGVPENSASGTTVGNLSSSDPNSSDTHTYQLVAGTGDTDNSAFTISGNQLKLAVSPDFETKSSYSIRVQSTDNGGLTFAKTLTISVSNVNEAPTASALSDSNIQDGDATGTVVGTLSATDPDTADTFTYTLVSGTGSTDNASFTISGNELRTAFVANQATKSSYAIRVRAQDAGGLSFERTYTITVTDTNQAPTAIQLSSNSLPENGAIGAVVGTLSSNDADAGDTHTYTLVTGTGDTDNALFQIVGNELRLASSLNFETKPNYQVRVRSTDSGGLTFESALNITVTNVNEAPSLPQLSATSVADGTASGQTVATISATDSDAGDTLTYSLVSGTGSTDNASFTVNGNQLLLATTVNMATKSSYSIRLKATDAAGLSSEQTVVITVTETATAPTAVLLSNQQIAENATSGTAVGQLTSTDVNSSDTHTYSLVAGTGDTDNAAFVIVGNELRTASTFDFENKSSYSIRVRSTDSSNLTFDQVLLLTITNVNEAPSALQFSSTSIVDGTASGQTVATLSATDPDAGDTLTYALATGTGDTDNASFTIDGNQLKLATTVDKSTQSSYSVRVKATDAAGLSTELSQVITVTEAPAAPTAVALSNDQIAESATSGTAVGQLSSTDPSTTDAHTYSLVSGTGDTDNAAFAIVGNELRTATGFDFESKSSYSIRVRTTDLSNLSFDQVLTLTITNVNESPSGLQLSTSSIVDGTASGQNVATISAVDPDAGDSLTYTLVTGTGDIDNASFTVSGDQLQLATTVDRATKASYSIRLKATDVAGLSTEQTMTISVTEANVAPTDVNLSTDQIAENQSAGTAVGQLSSTDANASDTHTYTLVSGTGDTDNAAFEIVGTELRAKSAFDFETKPSYSVRIQTADAGGLMFERVFTVTVTNVNEAPTAVTISNNTIADQQTSGTVVGVLGTTDPDAGDTFSYTLVSGTGDTDNGVFQIVNGDLVINENVDAAIQNMYSVRVKSADAGGLEFEQILQILVGN